jgi:hypothetical protein
MRDTAKSRGTRMRKKTSKGNVRKVFQDLGIEPIDGRRDALLVPLTPWPNTGSPLVYRTTLSNGTGKVMRFDAELE